MVFGSAGSAATFSKVMDAVLMGLTVEECLVYLDDNLNFSATVTENARRMRLLFEHIRVANFKLGRANSIFAAPMVS